MSSRRSQSGYMLEIPPLMLVVGVVLAVALPRVPLVLSKVLMAAGTLAWIGGLYYMILAPGWMPGNQPPMRRMWKWILFLVLAGFLVFGAGVYVLNAGTPLHEIQGAYL